MKESEHLAQCAVIEWCDLKARTGWPELARIFAIPNGGERHGKVAMKLKSEGVKKGVHDLFLPLVRRNPKKANQYYAGAFIEMKVGRNKPTPEQQWWATQLIEAGYACFLCYGSEQGITAIKYYYGLEKVRWAR